MSITSIIAEASVLCVDDNADNLELIRALLETRGAAVATANSASQAIALLETQHFDAIVSDISMPPGLDGYDLAHAVRNMEAKDPERPATPMVAVSGKALVPSRKRRFADFQVYLRKPFDSARLLNVIERLIESDGDAVAAGSLGLWEAKQATRAAADATVAATTATAAAIESAAAARDATDAAREATAAAADGKLAADATEAVAAAAAAKAPPGAH